MIRLLLLLVLCNNFYAASLIQKPMRKVLLRQGSPLIFQQDTRTDLVFLSFNVGLPLSPSDQDLRLEVASILLNYLVQQEPRLKDGFRSSVDFPILQHIYRMSDCLRVHISFLNQDFSSLMSEYFTSIFFPTWDEDVFQKVLYKEIERIGAEKASVFGQLRKESYHLIYPDTNYQAKQFPDVSVLSSLSITDLQKLHEEIFHPLNMSFAVIGNIELSTTVTVLHDVLSQLQVKKPLPMMVEGRKGVNERRFFSSQLQSSAAILSFAGPQYSHNDSLAFMVLEKLLRRGFSGRLAQSEQTHLGLTNIYTTVNNVDSELRLDILFELDGEKPQIFARNLFETLDLFRNHLVSDVELQEIKIEMKESYASSIAGGIAGSVVLANRAFWDFKYILPIDFNRQLDELSVSDIRDICGKYLDFDNYHFYTLEPEKNRDLSTKQAYSYELHGIKIILKEDPSYDEVGISWSYDLPEHISNTALPYVAAFALGHVTSSNPEAQRLLNRFNVPLAGFPIGEKLIMFGSISEFIWRDGFIRFLPQIMLERTVTETDLQQAKSSFDLLRQNSSIYSDTSLFYREFMSEKKFFWVQCCTEHSGKELTLPELQHCVQQIIQPSGLRLVMTGNFNAAQVYQELEKSFAGYFVKHPDLATEAAVVKEKLLSVEGRIVNKAARTKVFDIEGDRFYYQSGSVFRLSELSTRRMAAFVVYAGLVGQLIQKENAFPEAKISIEFSTNGELIPLLLKIEGPKNQREEIITYAKNLESRSFAGVENVEDVLSFLRKILLLADHYSQLNSGAKALALNLHASIGLKENYQDEILKYLKDISLADIKEAYGFFMEKKDYELLFR